MIRLFVLIFLLVPQISWGQSSLPPCTAAESDRNAWRHNCFGTFTFANGDKYVGEFRDGKRHGQGTYTFANGDKYVGEFRDNKRHGQGTYTFASGNKYVGEFRNDKLDGQGTLTAANGNKYVGEFKDNKLHGQGIQYWSDGSIAKSGQWADNALTQSYALDTNRFPFNSNVADVGKAERDRVAAVTSPQTQNESPGLRQSTMPPCPSGGHNMGWNDCFGTVTYPSGTEYTGEFRNGRFQGYGIYKWPNGDRYVGEYSLGEFNGDGIEYSADGSVRRSGTWKNGSLVQSIALDTSRFPYAANPQTAGPLAQGLPDSAKQERDRLAAEVEAERKKRNELEERLAAESNERERLAQEAREREKQLAEAKERERQQAQAQQPQRQEAISRFERRVALVVGNGAYKQSPLDNAVNDATDLNAALKTLGFQTILLQNSSLQMMKQKTREFADLAINADVALIFYSGHGIEYRGNNYLIPTSTGSLREFEVEDETFNVSRWMDMLETQKGANKQRVNIVILDACRDNAFSRGWRNTNRGLARMDAPSGTILAYSTSPGKVASDGNRGDRNSPYTKSLLRAIQQQNTPIEQVFKDVRRMVVEQTKGEQVPWENSSLIGNFVFKR